MKHTEKNELIPSKPYDEGHKFAQSKYSGKLDYFRKNNEMDAQFPSIAYAINKEFPLESIKSLVEMNEGDAINQSILVEGQIRGDSEPKRIKVPTIIYALEQKRMDVFKLLIEHPKLNMEQDRTMEKFNSQNNAYERYGVDTLLGIVLDNCDLNVDIFKLVLKKYNQELPKRSMSNDKLDQLISSKHFDIVTELLKTGLKFDKVSYSGKLDYSSKDNEMEAKFPSIAYAIKKEFPLKFIKSLVEMNQGDAINQSILVEGKMTKYSQTKRIKVPTIIYALEQKRMDVFELLIEHPKLDIEQDRTMEEFNSQNKAYKGYGVDTLLNIVLDNKDINIDIFKLVLKKCNRDTFSLSSILDILKKNPDIGCLIIEKFNLVNTLDKDSNRIIDLVVKKFNLNSHNTELLKLIKILRDLGSVEPKEPISVSEKGANNIEKLTVLNGSPDIQNNMTIAPKILKKLYEKCNLTDEQITKEINDFILKDFQDWRNTEWSTGQSLTIQQVVEKLAEMTNVQDRLSESWSFKKVIGSIIHVVKTDLDLTHTLTNCLSQLKMCDLDKFTCGSTR